MRDWGGTEGGDDAQMLAMLHGEEGISSVSAMRLMTYCEFALHVDVDSRQQLVESVEHPSLHEHPLVHYRNHENTRQNLAGSKQSIHVMLWRQ